MSDPTSQLSATESPDEPDAAASKEAKKEELFAKFEWMVRREAFNIIHSFYSVRVQLQLILSFRIYSFDRAITTRVNTKSVKVCADVFSNIMCTASI